MDSAQVLQQFWSGFGLKAYDENTVPEGAMAANGDKYLTYNVSAAYFDEPVMMSSSLWYKSQSWAEITEKAMQIGAYIGLGGKFIPFDNGKLWIKRGTPFAQRMSDENEQIRRIYLNVEVEYLTSQ